MSEGPRNVGHVEDGGVCARVLVCMSERGQQGQEEWG
jgi:hypothetical protein